jgi:multidrug efflux pump subunit AcrA (membrane-fusion protein)
MIVDTSASEADVHRLRAGQTATIALEAFPGVALGGKLMTVGTLASTSPDRPLQEKRFDVAVEVDSSETELRPGMTARVDLHVARKPNVLVVPISAVFTRDGQPVCHVVGRWNTETRRVELGEANDFLVEITTGLHEGERVLLVDPRGQMTPGVGSAAGVTKQSGGPARNNLAPR